jgi:hypothetical protein
MKIPGIDELIDELRAQTDEFEFNLETAAVWMRYAYGLGYQCALQDPSPDRTAAMLREREAWARLP